MNVKSIMDIRRIFAKRKDAVYSVSLGLKIVRFLKKTEEIEAFFYERHKRILDKCVEKDENGDFVEAPGGYKLHSARIGEYEDEMRELCEEMTEERISFTEKDTEELKLTLEEFCVISDYLEV